MKCRSNGLQNPRDPYTEKENKYPTQMSRRPIPRLPTGHLVWEPGTNSRDCHAKRAPHGAHMSPAMSQVGGCGQTPERNALRFPSVEGACNPCTSVCMARHVQATLSPCSRDRRSREGREFASVTLLVTGFVRQPPPLSPWGACVSVLPNSHLQVYRLIYSCLTSPEK